MEINSNSDNQLHRFPQFKAVDAVRWIPSISAFDRHVVAAMHDPSASTSSIDVHSFTTNPTPTLHLCSTWTAPSRITSLSSPPHSAHASLFPIAVSTFAGSLHFLFLDPIEGVVQSEASVPMEKENGVRGFHDGTVSAVDLQVGGRECVTVGEDGRVNVVNIEQGGKVGWRRIDDSMGLVSYTAVKWGSPTEFATGSLGFGIQLWDQRKPTGLVSQFKGDWGQGTATGIVHSIDIHPSRKHICVVGGSSGTVFAWDLRWQQQPIMLSGIGVCESSYSPCESEVWEVQCDSHVQSGFISAPSTTILPTMMCSEDGILGVLRQGEEPIEILAENCAINSFAIDPQNPSDIVCGLEWESIAILTRLRESMPM
ncbi:WD40 repeat-containing protein [Zostera marina]|uniref:WD40 repeat-containing protein n=1 Tax=Zostera marina TaxID=29655 RepID=A0A0K9PTI8_ZOSMR|nr:WD40 repeat-containing protein [Zostera marina]